MAERGGRGTDEELLRRYLEEIEVHSRLDSDQEHELGVTIQGRGPDAPAARRRLVQSNLRHVVEVARRYATEPVDLLDLIQEGNLGLVRAADRYDPASSFEFSAFATWWVRRAIGRAMDETTRGVRRPHPETWAVPDGTDNLSYALLDRLTAQATFGDDTADTDRHADPRMFDDDDLAPYEIAAAALERSALTVQMSRLKPQERQVLQARFGWTAEPQRLEEIGADLETTTEHVREIEEKALSKLRHPSVARLWAHHRPTGS